MKILITGGNGRIGRHVLSHLTNVKENEIWVLQKSIHPDKRLQTIEEDLSKELNLTKEESSIKFDLVIHMAGVTHMGDSKEVGDNNYSITKNLLNYLLKANRNTPIIFFSSVDVYGIRDQNFPIHVKSDCNPSSYYGKAKLSSEILLTENLSTVTIFRVAPMIDFEGRDDFLKRVYIPGTKIKFRSPYNRENSFSDIKSICSTIDLCIAGASMPIVNVTNGNIYTEKDFLDNSLFAVRFPKAILDAVFLILSKINKPWAYSLEHQFHKLFKTNTYV